MNNSKYILIIDRWYVKENILKIFLFLRNLRQLRSRVLRVFFFFKYQILEKNKRNRNLN